MRKIEIIALLGLFCLSVFAVPARRGWVNRTLADGSVIEVQLRGDEYYHYMETREGKMVTMSDEGLVISDESLPTAEQVLARRMASPLMAGKAKKIGGVNLAPRGLLILANFSDVAFLPENSNAAMDSMMNYSGYSYNGATGSARDYFIAQSDSQYMPVFDVVGPVTLPQTRWYYGGNSSSREGSDRMYYQLAIDACKAVDDSVDFSIYDNDHDGNVDFVYIIYADMGENDGGPAESIWPHNSRIKDYIGKNVRLDGKYLNNYACSGELEGGGARNTIGTPCHEFGHVIGLPDYYDTNGEDGYNYIYYLTPNEWSIMDYGCYNNNGNTPPNYSIFDKYYLGWATPTLLPANAALNVTLTTGYNDTYMITGGTSLLPVTTTQTVYYLENRQQQGWDAYLTGHGMLVWQVKYNSSAWTNNTFNNTAGNPRYTVIAADGNTMIGYCTDYNEETGRWDILIKTGETDPFPGAAQVTSWNKVSGCALTDIAESEGVVSFKYNGGAPVDPTETISVMGDGLQVTGRKILLDGQLVIVRGEKKYNAQGIEIQ